MQNPELSVAAYQHAWLGIAFVCAYYALCSILVRWRRRDVLVTRYEPPGSVSPAIAAFVWDRGRYERAFTAAFISLASKGFFRIEQSGQDFQLHRLRENDAALPSEEASILTTIFPGSLESYSFSAREYGAIDRAFQEFQATLARHVRQRFVSNHVLVWCGGLAMLLIVLIRALASLSPELPELNLASVESLYVLMWMAIGGSCFVAALHAWAATGRKLLSFVPGVRGRRRALGPSDALAVFLTASALLGLGFLGSMTSPGFAALVAATLFLATIFRHGLESPTRVGRKVLGELLGFREFLARADANRLDRENSPCRTPEVLEKFTAYAVALDVERGWGEELAESLLELLQFDQAYQRGIPGESDPGSTAKRRTYPPIDSILELGISARKVSE